MFVYISWSIVRPPNTVGLGLGQSDYDMTRIGLTHSQPEKHLGQPKPNLNIARVMEGRS